MDYACSHGDQRRRGFLFLSDRIARYTRSSDTDVRAGRAVAPNAAAQPIQHYPSSPAGETPKPASQSGEFQPFGAVHPQPQVSQGSPDPSSIDLQQRIDAAMQKAREEEIKMRAYQPSVEEQRQYDALKQKVYQHGMTWSEFLNLNEFGALAEPMRRRMIDEVITMVRRGELAPQFLK